MIMIKFQMFFFIESFDVLHVIRIIFIKVKVKSLLYLVCVSFEPMRDYAGLSYASLDLVMPRWFGYVSIEPMRDYAGFGYASLLFRLCFVGFGYVSIVFVVSVMFL
jgi:hypothetical protein